MKIHKEFVHSDQLSEWEMVPPCAALRSTSNTLHRLPLKIINYGYVSFLEMYADDMFGLICGMHLQQLGKCSSQVNA